MHALFDRTNRSIALSMKDDPLPRQRLDRYLHAVQRYSALLDAFRGGRLRNVSCDCGDGTIPEIRTEVRENILKILPAAAIIRTRNWY